MARTKPSAGVTFTAERAPLLAALAAVIRTIEARAVVAIYSHFLIIAGEGRVSVRGTDSEIETTAHLPAEVAIPGSLTAPAHALHDLVRRMGPGVISVEVQEDGRTVLRSGRSRFVLPGLDPKTFPSLTVPTDLAESTDPARRFTLAGTTLGNALAELQSEISTEETRYYLNGVFWHPVQVGAETHLRLCATDGTRLGRIDLGKVDDVGEGHPGVIIPRKTVDALKRLCEAAGEGRVHIAVSRAIVQVEAADVTMTSKLIDGTFPDYARVIPDGNELHAVVATANLVAAIERVAIMAQTSEKDKARSIDLAFAPEGITLSARSNEGSEGFDVCDVDYPGPPTSIRFSVKLLLDALAATGGDTVRISLHGNPGTPAIFRHAADGPSLHVVMPMRK